MFMYSVKHQRASSVAHVCELLAAHPDARPLAGGQSLIAGMKLRLSAPSLLVDLGGLRELTTIQIDAQHVTLGAMVRHAQVAQSEAIRKVIPALASLAKGIGDPMVRNMGTVGGSVANNDPAADYPAAVVALDAVVTTTTREIAADDFFVGMFETALLPGELITAVKFRIPKRAAYLKFKNPASRFAMVGVFVADFGSAVRVAVVGASAGVFRVAEMERALGRRFHAASLDGIEVSSAELLSDLHSQAVYRAHLIAVLAKRAVQSLTESGSKP